MAPTPPSLWDKFLRNIGKFVLILALISYGPSLIGRIAGTISSSMSSALGGQAPSPTKNTVGVNTSDSEINAAMAKARGNLNEFWAKLERPSSGESGFMIKAALPTPGGSLEHIWVGELTRNNGQINGSLANAPKELKGLSEGSKVTFSTEQVSDWMFRRNGKIVGNETARLLIARMPEKEAARYRDVFEAP